MSQASIGIIGAGNSAHALAAYLASLGHRITIYARNTHKIDYIAKTKSIKAVGKVEGEFPIDCVTDDLKELADRCSMIFFATVTTAYRSIVPLLAPHLHKGHILVAFSSKLAGSQEIAHSLDICGIKHVEVCETDALFACRIREDGAIWIRGFKDWNLFASPTRTKTMEYGSVLRKFFPQLEPADNLVQRGLTDFGALAHPLITLINAGRIDRQEHFLFYYESLSERTVVLLEKMEKELNALAHAYNTTLIPMKELLNRYYGCNTDTLLNAITSVPNYKLSVAPHTLNHRYLQEDVANTLIPAQQLARKAHLETPVIDSVITFSSVLLNEDFRKTGRHLGALGLDRMSQKEILAWMAS